MARRVRTLTNTAPSVVVPTFGDSANSLRVTQHMHGLDEEQNARVVISVNTGAAPDTDLDGDTDTTFVLPPTGEASVFLETVPATAWDVRLTMLPKGNAPQNVVVEMEEF